MSGDSEAAASAATVLGFGGRVPADVLDILLRSGIRNVFPKRSQNITSNLRKPPYRTFVRVGETAVETTKTPGLFLYCLPTSISEYIYFHEEAASFRSLLFQNKHHVLAVYDATSDAILGGTADSVLQALGGDEAANSGLAAASLEALADLDKQVAQLKTLYSQSKMHSNTVIVVGSGGREHALAVALAKSPLVDRVICCPGNGGTQLEGGKISNQCLNQENATVIHLVKETSASMVVVGPEGPLVDGLVDQLALTCPGVRAFGPTKAAAELEASKAFTKDFLEEHGIPTAKYRNFTNVDEALAYVQTLDDSDRQVVKASGLAAGKGVLLPTTKQETIEAVKEIMADKAFGSAGDTCVIESFLTGPEASCLAFCDGKTAVLMPAAQDHKRALDNDEGLNTGGMGAYAPAPCVTPRLQREIEEMCRKTVEKMAERGTPYVGVLYAGMMLTPDGPKVLEFNCRFGDPETQVVLPLLENDLYDVMVACCDGKLDQVDVRFKENLAATTVVCAALGYPEAYPKGMQIVGTELADAIGCAKVYHAGTVLDDDGLVRCSGGRVLAVTGLGTGLKAATQLAYQGANVIDFVADNGVSQIHRRTDIAKGALRTKVRLGILGSTRGTALLPVMESIFNGALDAEIVAVVSNRSDALILEKGTSMGPTVTTKFVPSKGLTREQHDAECTSVFTDAGVDLVLLIGYMKILSKPFCDFWAGRCINVHPSLLPKFAGGMDLAVHQAVIDAGEKESGCTIHHVTEDVDSGDVIVQKKIAVSPDDSAESLKSKVQALEGLAFIEAIKLFCKGDVTSYADSGVSIDAGNALVDMIKPACKATKRPGCDADLGGFGGLFDLAAAGYNAADTVLIGATDGVGTKLKIAQIVGNHQWVGIDLVAMCVNDLIVAGGEPLFFLDYFATGKLDIAQTAQVVIGIAEGCKESGCGLIGGETAEMPSMYAPGEYDLAGFAVGAVNRGGILPKSVQEGDVLLGLPSSGVHSNGFSLVRKLIEKEGLSYSDPCPWDSSGVSVGDSLLTPTRIYVKECLPLLKKSLVKGMAHITGGGLIENLPRSLPTGIGAKITGHPLLPSIFKWLKSTSGLDDTEMLRTFNCGVGMVLIVAPENALEVKSILSSHGDETVFDLGVLIPGHGVAIECQI